MAMLGVYIHAVRAPIRLRAASRFLNNCDDFRAAPTSGIVNTLANKGWNGGEDFAPKLSSRSTQRRWGPIPQTNLARRSGMLGQFLQCPLARAAQVVVRRAGDRPTGFRG
jgi:hypothetical protein